MFQTGYLTIKQIDYEKNRYLLEFPNKEVRDSFLDFAVENYTNSSLYEMENKDYLVEKIEKDNFSSRGAYNKS